MPTAVPPKLNVAIMSVPPLSSHEHAYTHMDMWPPVVQASVV